MAIQIDMFEVQLGAALLLQFEHGDDVVRVLADAGVKASGYRPDHVHRKLETLIGPAGERRIDLVIGTHYDEDHLLGLVPIIEDRSIAIGEAWLPPVVNDTRPPPLDRRIGEEDLLAHQLGVDGGHHVLRSYLATKRRDIELINLLGNEEKATEKLRTWHRQAPDGDIIDEGQQIEWFRQQLASDGAVDECDHGVLPDVDDHPEVEQAIASVRGGALFPYWNRYADLDAEDLHSLAMRTRELRPAVGASQARSLANIRKGAAKDAINAKALHAVVAALTDRGIAIRHEIVEDGQPKRFRWDAGQRRFLTSGGDRSGLTFDLLGPSRSLVRKHAHRLPVEDAARVALSFSGEILSITPSNQLSYIGRFDFDQQGMLVSGDAGCVDFKVTGRSYARPLLDAMLPLHLVQVAHHAGNNAHFYRVLEAAGYPEQTDPSLLLLSHARHDRTRPSPAFKDFLLATIREGDDVRLLFTSEPRRSKVTDFVDAIHAPEGDSGVVGDIRVRHDEAGWHVLSHAIDRTQLTDPA